MTATRLICKSCGVIWLSAPAQQLVRRSGCLRCGAPSVEEERSFEYESPPVPNDEGRASGQGEHSARTPPESPSGGTVR